jgi:dTDP-4-amino-4,6-dideoxygalactose transaminase
MGERYYYDRFGVNSRLDSIQAAILRIKLRELDSYINSRQKAAKYYTEFFSKIDGIETPGINEKSTHVYHQYTLKASGVDQFALQSFLGEKGIPAMIYYPMPLHGQKAYDTGNYKEEDFIVTNELCKCVFSLPMHTELEEDQLAFICESVKEFIER